MPDFTKYYGADMAGFILTFASIHLLGSQRRVGFILGAVASVFWGIFSYMAESPSTLLANAVFLGMNLRGYARWGKPPVGKV